MPTILPTKAHTIAVLSQKGGTGKSTLAAQFVALFPISLGLFLALLKYNGAPVSLQLPQYVELAVVSSELGMRGDTAAGGATKQATLETGLTVRVPLFIRN